ncbi:phytanoyl-CoA dioxygenase family protein [Gammaproteobacteria bacterium]|nr:phytanoyl-CoA dioxygenase family protein [Gammaproteobacteria bacterium]
MKTTRNKGLSIPYSKSSPPLTKEQIARFEQNGYLIFDLDLEAGFIDRLLAGVEPLYPAERLQNPTAPARLQDAWKTVDEVRQLAVSPIALAALEQLYGRAALPFQTLNFPIGTRQLTHSDTIHFNSIPKGFMAGVWVALEDINTSNGPLQYYPGSHKLHEYSMQDFGLESGYENYRHYEACIQEVLEAEALMPAFGTIKQGQALIWHANLLHGGAAQTDLARSRHSQVTHYYFEDCAYYTPMNSRANKPSFRTPFWIPSTSDFELPDTGGRAIVRRIARRLGFR